VGVLVGCGIRRAARRRRSGVVTAVLAAAARAVLAAVLVLAIAGAVLCAVLWAAYGPQDARLPAWFAAMFVVVAGAATGLAALRPEGDGDRG
jgi:hypothetical protein